MNSQVEEEQPGFGFIEVGLIGIMLLAPLAWWLLVRPSFGCRRTQGPLTACKSNLKNMGTAMEMYSVDWSGRYPTGNTLAVKSHLTPNYLKTIPACPAGGTDTYGFALGPKAPYNTQNYEDYYFIQCNGPHHAAVGVPKNYPQYTGAVGLIER